MGNGATIADGKTADPPAPETLIYRRGTDGKLLLVGVMYRYDDRQGEPPEIAGPYTRWHTHEFCVGSDGRRIKGMHRHGEACPSGAQERESGSMMHVWFVEEDALRRAYARRPPVRALEEYQESLS
ncbi:MAG: hypothetical protein GEV07_28030 [Streptosporangiales bacterium]|nr:hypothetical protein [Streptosporangiales bacterium]